MILNYARYFSHGKQTVILVLESVNEMVIVVSNFLALIEGGEKILTLSENSVFETNLLCFACIFTTYSFSLTS